MLEQICKIAPELSHSTSKIGSVLAFNRNYLAFIIDFNSIELVEYNKKNRKSIRLSSHNKPIKCINFSRDVNSEVLLCSCSSDAIILWNVNSIFETRNVDGKIIGKNCFNYEPTHCNFDSQNQIIAVSNGDLISLFDIKSSSLFGEIKFNDCINYFEFASFNNELLFISTQTNLLLCHDLGQNVTVNSIQSSTSNSFLQIACLDNEPIVLVTSTEGAIHIYKFISDKFLIVNKINLVQIYQDFLKQTKNSSNFDRTNLSVCTGLQIFRLNEQLITTCATSTCIFLIDFYTNDLIYLIDLKTISLRQDESLIVPQMVEFCISDSKQINAALLFLFHNEIIVVKCADVHVNKKNFESLAQNSPMSGEDDYLTVHPRKGLVNDSPLNDGVNEKETTKPKLPTSMHEYVKTNSLTKKSLTLQDKPLTFSSKIKSSGYSSVSKREKFTPMINKNYKSSSLINLDNLENSKAKQSTSKFETKIKEFKFELPSVLNQKVNATDRSSPLLLLRFSDDGQNVAIASNDNLIQYISSKNVDKNIEVYNGHNDTIRSIDLSHDGKLLLSSSDDKTCKLWSLKKPAELLIDIKSIKLTDTTSFNFKKEVTAASFFYLDKFLLIGSDKNLFLCKYHIDTNKNDIQRYVNNSFCKSVKKFELTFAQSVTTISTINSFYSYMVLCGGTDKSIEVFDMNEAKSCLTIHDAHSRPFHQLLQNQSEFNRLSYDLFISNAVGDGVKLWDLRNAQCVNRFDSHMNRCLPTKVSFSPDSNYLAAGSEDRSTLVYDLRMNGIVKKYGVFSDTVSCAQFNPKKSQLLCGTQDGKLYSYLSN